MEQARMSATAPNMAPSDVRHCPKCRAELRAGTIRCWLCEAEIQTVAADSAAAPPAASQVVGHPERLGSFSLASLMMFITLVSVVLGVSTIALGVGIPLGVVLLIVWLRTAAVTCLRVEQGRAVTRSERVQLFLASFGVTLALIAVTCVAGCAAVVGGFFACKGTYAGLGALGARESLEAAVFAFLVWCVVGLLLAIPTLWWMAKVIGRRWRRDIGDQVPADKLLVRLFIIMICIMIIAPLLWWLIDVFGWRYQE